MWWSSPPVPGQSTTPCLSCPPHPPCVLVSVVRARERGHIARYARAKMLVGSGSTDASSLVVRRGGGHFVHDAGRKEECNRTTARRDLRKSCDIGGHGIGRHEKEQEGLPSSATSNAKQPIMSAYPRLPSWVIRQLDPTKPNSDSVSFHCFVSTRPQLAILALRQQPTSRLTPPSKAEQKKPIAFSSGPKRNLGLACRGKLKDEQALDSRPFLSTASTVQTRPSTEPLLTFLPEGIRNVTAQCDWKPANAQNPRGETHACLPAGLGRVHAARAAQQPCDTPKIEAIQSNCSPPPSPAFMREGRKRHCPASPIPRCISPMRMCCGGAAPARHSFPRTRRISSPSRPTHTLLIPNIFVSCAQQFDNRPPPRHSQPGTAGSPGLLPPSQRYLPLQSSQ